MLLNSFASFHAVAVTSSKSFEATASGKERITCPSSVIKRVIFGLAAAVYLSLTFCTCSVSLKPLVSFFTCDQLAVTSNILRSSLIALNPALPKLFSRSM